MNEVNSTELICFKATLASYMFHLFRFRGYAILSFQGLSGSFDRFNERDYYKFRQLKHIFNAQFSKQTF